MTPDVTPVDEFLAAAAYLRKTATEDELHTAIGGSRWGPMAPSLARLVADWLESVADRLKKTAHPDWHDVIEHNALAVARAINTHKEGLTP